MKVLLFGAHGQLGTDLHRVFQAGEIVVVPVTHEDLDVRNREGVLAAVMEVRPDVVVNTTAFHKVEECEEQPSISFDVNATGPRNLAQACHRAGCVLVHFSTDYVFDGRQQTPYTEDDLPHPLSVYAASKLAGEHLMGAVFDRNFIIRTCGLYGLAGSKGRGGNFVETMLKKAASGSQIRVVDDQVLTPTFTADLAEVVARLIKTEEFGLYHVSSEGECSWYEFARKILLLENLSADLRPVTTDQFGSLVNRPGYSVLDKRRLHGLGIMMPRWEDALERYLRARREEYRGIR